MRTPRFGTPRAVGCLLVIAGLSAFAAFPASSPASSANVPCTKASISKAVTAAGKAQKTTAKLLKKQFKCAGGWAYADANLGTGAEAVTVTFVFKASGKVWALKNRAKVCKGPGNQVPAAIYKPACTTN
jgi:hypothetical protein